MDLALVLDNYFEVAPLALVAYWLGFVLLVLGSLIVALALVLVQVVLVLVAFGYLYCLLLLEGLPALGDLCNLVLFLGNYFD